jgi:outer membrane protein OmpA-like peptidoglycan-associated protein
MNHLSFFRRVFFAALALFSIAAQAQSVDFILDVKNSGSKTGCNVDIVSTGSTLEGIDVRVTATVDRSSKTVTKLTVSECQGGSFGLSTTLPSNTPVGIGVGVNGSDVVEMAVPLASIWQPPQSLSLFFSSFNASTGSQDLAPDANGGTIPPGSNFSIPYSIPAMGWLGLIITALILLIIGILALRKRHIYLAISLLSLATLGIAAGFIADGNIGDWQGVNAIVNDPSGDEVPSDASADILAVFVAVENEQLFVRFDVTNLDNVAPLASDVSESVLEDGSVTIALSGTDDDGDVLTFSIMDAPVNGSLGPVTPINNNSASVEFTPDADFNGVESFTYKASDGDLDSVAASVDITVDSVNDEPSFTAGTDQAITEDEGAQSVAGWATAISAGPADENTQIVNFNVSNDNNALFAVQPSVDASGALTYTPAPDANGLATVSVDAMDDGGSANGGVDTSAAQTFTITIAGINDEPAFTKGADETVDENAGMQSVAGWATAISAGPANENTQIVSFSVGNDNNALFAVQPSVDASGGLTYTPATDANGSATVTVTAMDDGGTANGGDDTSDPQSFTITVSSVNQAPSFTKGANESILEDAGFQTVAGWATAISAGPADENTQIVSFTVSNDNNALFAVQPSVDASGALTYTPAPDANGLATVSVEAMDDGGTANGGVDTSAAQTFTITIAAVNDPPIFNKGADQTVNENAGAQTVNNWVFAFTVGPANEGTQVISFNVLNDNNALFAVQPAIDATGGLTYTPATDANGSATVTVTAMDDGGTANGGVDTSATAQFSIVVAAAPIISAINSTYDTTYLEPGTIITMNAVISDPDDATLGGISWNVVLDGNTLNSGTGQFLTTTYMVQPTDQQPSIELQVSDATGNNVAAPLFSEPVITCENYEALDAPVNFDFQPNLPGESIQQGDSATAFFANTTDVINARSQQVLDILVTSMATHPTTTYTMEGHTSECGTNEENIVLGQARASAALAYLVSAGGDSSRLKTISYGEERPFCTESNVACWQQNSRVQIIQSGGMSSYIQPVALDDTWSFAPGYNQDIAASAGIFMDNGSGADDLGSPEASLTSFGGGSLGGAVTDHAANTSVPLAGGNLTVNADGSWSLTGQPFTPGTYTFDYRLTNAATNSDAQVTLVIQSPAITWNTPDPFCSFSNQTCSAPTDIDFMPVGACNNKAWTVTAEWDENADGGPLVDATAGITQSGLSFAASGSYPIGDHLLIVSATDDCGVTVTDSIPFSVVDCKASTPICINGLSVSLLPVSPPSDVDGDGDLDYAAMTIWATDFIAAAINDCSGPIQYSINLAGQTPDIADTGEVLTCDNDATTVVEVHGWDQAGNSDYCETYVLVTDNSSLCTVP